MVVIAPMDDPHAACLHHDQAMTPGTRIVRWLYIRTTKFLINFFKGIDGKA